MRYAGACLTTMLLCWAASIAACGDKTPPPAPPRPPVACEPAPAPRVCELVGEHPERPSITGRVRPLYPGLWTRAPEPDDPPDLGVRETLAIVALRVDGRSSHFVADRSWVLEITQYAEADGVHHGDVDACLEAIGLDRSPTLDHPQPDAAP